jgi:hypothetical protein
MGRWPRVMAEPEGIAELRRQQVELCRELDRLQAHEIRDLRKAADITAAMTTYSSGTTWSNYTSCRIN